MSDTRVEVSGDQPDERLGRRTVLRGVAIGGVGLTALAACGSDDDSGSSDSSSDTSDDGGSSEPSESPSDKGGGNNGGTELATTSEVPVGGGAVFGDDGVVVTQPSEGTFVAFSSVCTHQGCTVENVADGTINCGCHGSRFSIEDGSVVNGPATAPLPSENVTVQGNKIMRG